MIHSMRHRLTLDAAASAGVCAYCGDGAAQATLFSIPGECADCATRPEATLRSVNVRTSPGVSSVAILTVADDGAFAIIGAGRIGQGILFVASGRGGAT